MSKIEIRNLKLGQEFFEVDHGIVVKWVALEDARKVKDFFECLCRRDGTEIEIVFSSAGSAAYAKAPVLLSKLSPNTAYRIISWEPL